MARVVVVGAGAVGCYYGALLAKAGHDVGFVLRRDFDAVSGDGLRITSPSGSFHLKDARALRSAAEAGRADWVICSLKTTALAEAADLVAPAVGKGSRVLALMNGLGVEEPLARRFGPEVVFGGMAFVCINRGEPGTVHHLDYGQVTVGHCGDDPAETALASGLLKDAGIDAVSASSLLAARWEKLCWNIPFSGLGVAAGGADTSAILGDPELRALAEGAMREVVQAGNADLTKAGRAESLDPEDVVERMFTLTASMDAYRSSMVIDFQMGRPLEVESILGEPLRRATAQGIETPVMAVLQALVQYADRKRAEGPDRAAHVATASRRSAG